MSVVTIVGAGGIGAPAAWALAEAGVQRVVFVDDDDVERSNLHRQILFEEAHVGKPKLCSLVEVLATRYPKLDVSTVAGRALPDTALDLAKEATVLLDATDNFPSRFLLADAAKIAGVPVVHAAAVRWQATVMAVQASGKPCYRCLFEDIPGADAPDCATAGVVGPVCGVSGAIAADRVVRILRGDDADVYGHIATYDGLQDRLRRVEVPARDDCPLCGDGASIGSIEASRYMKPVCDAI
jgi:molybdopterin/thiamine biosynthesis adenylyltransferase